MTFDLLTSAWTTGLLAGTSAAAIISAGWLFGRYKAALAAVEKTNAEMAEAIESIGEGFYRSSLDGRMLFANTPLAKLNGYDRSEELLAAVNDIAVEWYVEPNRRAEFQAEIEKTGKLRNFTSQVYRHKTREPIWITENARIVFDLKTGKPSHYEGTIRETTDIMMRMQEKERLLKLTSNVPGGLFQLERKTCGEFEVVFSSPGFRELLDRNDNEGKFDLKRFLSIIHPDDLTGYHVSLKQSRKQMAHWSHEFRVVTDGGKAKWMKVQATPEVASTFVV